MKKTLFTRLFCILLIVALPFVAFAETTVPAKPAIAEGQQKVVTISLTPGEEMNQIPAVADLCNALSIELRAASNETVGLSLLLDMQEVFTANMRADDAGIFIESKQIYENPLYFSQADLQALLTEMMKSSGADSATIAQFEQSFSMGFMSGIQAAQIGESAQTGNSADLSDPEIRQALIDATGGDDSYLQFIEGLIGRLVETEGEFTSPDHDPASQKAELLVTEADIIAMLDTTFMKQQMKSQLATQDFSLSEAELDEKVADALAEAKEEIAKVDIQMPITVLSNGDDLIAILIPATFTERGEDDPASASMAMNYRQLTTDGTISHHFQMDVKEEDREIMSMDALVNKYQNGNYDLDFTVNAEGETEFSAKGIYEINGDGTTALLSLLPKDSEEIILQFTKAKTETGADRHLSFYTRKIWESQMVLSANDKPLFTLNVSTATIADDGRFDAINAATAESATQMLQLSGEELSNFETAVMAALTQTAMDALTRLPSSVSSLLMGTPVGE